jgi:DNA replication and repair protein RecF
MSSRPITSKHYLSSLGVKTFRNIESLHLELSPGINVLVGDNAQGKTNILETIAMLCSLRPLQSLNNSDLITQGHQQSSLFGLFKAEHDTAVEVEILPLGKKARINQKPVKSAARLHALLGMVSFIPSELNMIFGAATLRRRALDQAVMQIHFEHGQSLRAYEKLLASRNHLLKAYPIDHEQLHTYTSMLIQEAASIIFFRRATVKYLTEFFSECVDSIFGTFLHSHLQYECPAAFVGEPSREEIANWLEDTYARVRNEELRRRVTLFGPHTHDLLFIMENLPAQKSCSRGQSRALVLAFKMAVMKVIGKFRQIAPIVLLDDIHSELDQEKKNNLLRVVGELNCQAIFTCTEFTPSEGLLEAARRYHIKNGACIEIY